MSLTWDYETRSEINIATRGAYVYAQHPSTDALLASFKLKHTGPIDTNTRQGRAVAAWVAAAGPLNTLCRWRRGEPCPPYVRAYVEAGGEISAFNAAFERLIWWNVMVPKHGWPRPAMTQFRCEMATARALGLPASLKKLGEALDLKIKKDKRGDALIKIHSIPVKFDADGRAIWHPLADDPQSLNDFHDYCDIDVLSEEEASERMIPLSDAEMAVYHMSETINDRGVRIDAQSVAAAIELTEKAKADLDAQMNAATRGAVSAASQVARLTAWLASRGVALDGVAKDDILEALDLEDLPEDCREALLIRQQAAKPSTTKLKAFQKHVSPNGRIQGMFVYHGTGPGRWASAGGVNLSNLPRPRALYDKAVEDGDLEPATMFQAFRTAEPGVLRDFYGDELGKPMHLVSDAMRGFLWAAPGHEFIAVDYSGIQGALGAWLAGEEWKLQAMRDIIADPTLPDLYRRAAAGILNTTTEIITKKHPMRQAVGKTSELALLFAGGVSALVSMAANYGMRRAALHALYEPVWAATDEVAREKAIKRWEKNMKSRERRKTDVLSREAWLACSLIVYGWRENNPASVRAWSAFEEAMRSAVREPGSTQTALGRIRYKVASGFLWLQLPSGRCVAHAQPRLKDQVWAKLKLTDGSWSESEVCDRDEAEKLEVRGLAKIEGKTSPKVTVLGFDSTTQKMARYALYGGLMMQNCVGERTEVLTLAGWKTIVNVSTTDLLWDGENWVSHLGVIHKGVRQTIDFGGVRMTPDHRVMTHAGWKEAKNACVFEAVSFAGNGRPSWKIVWSSDGSILRRARRAIQLVGCSLLLRGGKNCPVRSYYQRNDKELRLCKEESDRRKNENSRTYISPLIQHLARDGGAVQKKKTYRFQGLWRTWNFCLREMAKICRVLRRHGEKLEKRAIARAKEQSNWIFASELHLGFSVYSSQKHPPQQLREHSGWKDAFMRSIRDKRDLFNDIKVQIDSLACRKIVRATASDGTVENVFDVLECGPNHRFTIRGATGASFIVSNCCLGSESDILRRGMRVCEQNNYRIVMHNYDEAIAEVRRGSGSVEEMERLMLQLEPWTEGLPLSAHGWSGKRNRK